MASLLVVGYKVIFRSDFPVDAIATFSTKKKIGKFDFVARFPGEVTKIKILVVDKVIL